MGLFSLDIEKLYDELEESGEQLKGIFCLQYPIYCIHANITDITSDPLDNLDKAIVDFFISKSDFTTFQIGSLMGTSKSLVELRIAKMVQDNLLTQKGTDFKISDLGTEVFKNKSQVRQHKQSYDFYIDGLTLKPLPRVFYTHYNSKLISENDSYHRTNARGESRLIRPFGPDLVHTPPNKKEIVDGLFNIEHAERELFSIPNGLQEINDISFTKLSLQLLVSVSSNGLRLKKQLIDGFAIYSLSENISYYETVRKNVKDIENTIQEKIENLEFKINMPRFRTDKEEQSKPTLTSNWQEIDKYKKSNNKCFSFSSEDLLKFIEQVFQISHVAEESIINSDKEIVINISKKMLLASSNRQKVVNDLIRARDYKFGNPDNNVFLLYLYYKTTDPFVNSIVDFKRILNNYNTKDITFSWIENHHPEFSKNYRQLLIAGGEFELLERLDIEKHMMPIF
jgi:hypothetical protein